MKKEHMPQQLQDSGTSEVEQRARAERSARRKADLGILGISTLFGAAGSLGVLAHGEHVKAEWNADQAHVYEASDEKHADVIAGMYEDSADEYETSRNLLLGGAALSALAGSAVIYGRENVRKKSREVIVSGEKPIK